LLNLLILFYPRGLKQQEQKKHEVVHHSTQILQAFHILQIGAWSNGIAIYGPYDGYTYNNVWHRNALYWVRN
jgi:hypothetical protein